MSSAQTQKVLIMMFRPLGTVSLLSEYMNIEHAAGTEERARDTGVNEEKRERLTLTNDSVKLGDVFRRETGK